MTIRSDRVEAQMQQSKRMPEWEHDHDGEQLLLSQTPQHYDDGPEFSSEPMPAAFSSLLFLGLAIVIGVLLAIFW